MNQFYSFLQYLKSGNYIGDECASSFFFVLSKCTNLSNLTLNLEQKHQFILNYDIFQYKKEFKAIQPVSQFNFFFFSAGADFIKNLLKIVFKKVQKSSPPRKILGRRKNSVAERFFTCTDLKMLRLQILQKAKIKFTIQVHQAYLLIQQIALISQIWHLILVEIILVMNVRQALVLLQQSALISQIQSLIFAKIKFIIKVHQTYVLVQQIALISQI
ncbi:hypothetical protein TTHERM_000819621 (macronuclear) [Tetrahymena thermophila SB210]|uniref:Uncharacterized protein n=1 Tax=Tetrahymena thermophila (strain SB210) TaxID=312017 RepID=W7X4V4_TETTS|nr:hypothetical protein TTHERM_000819621 [Tetrahymena thermophila SB210]EWS74355.1 hypothetical protein TTHERM_000819621 [Tetrahymena thermophila SB210]|eukprot:XP_012653115.1 hypothetical protein TTHERM_000819621 [Tetrahymena thermophila SB210]